MVNSTHLCKITDGKGTENISMSVGRSYENYAQRGLVRVKKERSRETPLYKYGNFNYSALAMVSPTSEVPIPILPAARLLILPDASVLLTAWSIARAASDSPSVSSIIPPAQMAASGLMMFWPEYLGAEPP